MCFLSVEDRDYDDAGRVTEVTWTDGVDTQSVVYDYDDGCRLGSRTDTGASTATPPRSPAPAST
jgi:YD repeat-containing protein